jgi:hypothetical protein
MLVHCTWKESFFPERTRHQQCVEFENECFPSNRVVVVVLYIAPALTVLCIVDSGGILRRRAYALFAFIRGWLGGFEDF